MLFVLSEEDRLPGFPAEFGRCRGANEMVVDNGAVFDKDEGDAAAFALACGFIDMVTESPGIGGVTSITDRVDAVTSQAELLDTTATDQPVVADSTRMVILDALGSDLSDVPDVEPPTPKPNISSRLRKRVTRHSLREADTDEDDVTPPFSPGPSKKKARTSKVQSKAASTMDDSEEKQEPRKPKGRKKTVLVAREARWRDIPLWENDSPCPLTSLPLEVLDRCFGARDDLDVSRHIAR